MGLLTILKKMKQKERELRLLMLYPLGHRSRQGSGDPAGRAALGAPYRARGCAAGWPIPIPYCASRTWALPITSGGGPGGGRTTGSGRGDSVPKAKGVGLMAQRPDQMTSCRGEVGLEGGPDATTR